MNRMLTARHKRPPAGTTTPAAAQSIAVCLAAPAALADIRDLKAGTVTTTGVTTGTVNANNARIGNLVIERGRCSGC